MERNERERERVTKERGLSFTSETFDVQEKREKFSSEIAKREQPFRGDL